MEDLWLQHDGANPLSAFYIRDVSKEHFASRWNARGSTTLWYSPVEM
jgi:hypothetical protein